MARLLCNVFVLFFLAQNEYTHSRYTGALYEMSINVSKLISNEQQQ